MDHGKLLRNAIIIGIGLAVVLVLLIIGAPMLTMLRVHLGM